MNENVVYKRITVILNTEKSLDGILPLSIRKGMIAKGLYDDPMAHNHDSDSSTISRYPRVLFRKGNKNTIVLVGINEGADYLATTGLPIGKVVSFTTSGGERLTTTIQSGKINQRIDHITVGGFHAYNINSPIILAKSDSNKKMFGMLMSAKGDELKLLLAKTLGRNIRTQIARMNDQDPADVPRIQVSIIEDPRIHAIQLKQKVMGVALNTKFAANVYFSGGKFGVGVGRYTSAGFGIVEVQR